MSCLKRILDGQDPDYEDDNPHEAKRLRLLEENAKAECSQRISTIVQQEFATELATREKVVHDIQDQLHEAQKVLHMLRSVVVSSFYNRRQLQAAPEDRQTRIHPAVKKLLGKEPRRWEPLHQRTSKYRPAPTDKEPVQVECKPEVPVPAAVSKVPRYIPPKTTAPVLQTSPSRGSHHKAKRRIVVGNVSKWVPVDTREDAASHKWMMYVRGPKEAPDVSGFVSKVRFFLHPSYRPHDIAEVTSPPFHLSRRGWGEFPIRVQVHFHHSLNKPVDIIHHLKLDRTYTGLQTLGAETVVDVWLNCSSEPNSERGGEGTSVVVTEDSVVQEEVVVNHCDAPQPQPQPPVIKEEPKADVASLDHDYTAQNHVVEPKLTTLMKCMDKSGRVFFLTLAKPQPTSLLIKPQPVQKNSQPVLFVKNGQLFMVKPAHNSTAPVSVLKKPSPHVDDSKTVLSGRTLVLNKANSRHVAQSGKPRYEDALNTAVEQCKFTDVALAVRWLLRHMPLVSTSAKDPEFKVLHPYAAPDESTFLQWNIGKRRAAEWLRAKAVRHVLEQRFPEDRVWRTHAIVLWARLHGYSPVPSASPASEPQPASPVQSTYSESLSVMDWLVTNHNTDSSESDVEVDVTSLDEPAWPVAIKQEPPDYTEVGSTADVLPLDSNTQAQVTFVRETARELGFKFVPEEVVPGVLHCTTEVMLYEAVRSLADDLLRRSLCRAWKRNSNRPPGCISLHDVQEAILSRPELNVFSNRGLGVQITDTS